MEENKGGEVYTIPELICPTWHRPEKGSLIMVETPDFLKDAVSRRTFLARMSAAGLGTAAAALLAGCGGSSSNSNGSNGSTGNQAAFADQANFPGIPGASENIVVLNYALTLETLEADLYRQALNIAAGKDVTTPLPADTSVYTQAVGNGGLSSSLAAVGFLYLQQYALVEAAHRDFLRAAITQAGATPVPANPKGYTTGLAVGADLKTILTLIRTVEEEGVRAYLGAAGFLTDLNLIQIASTIYTTEARHSAGVNYVLGLDAGPAPGSSASTSSDNLVAPIDGTKVSNNTFEFFKTPKQVLGDVKGFFVQ